jgi:MoaA/NifB/PqqE/SkfB family radical SAM enzyme
MAAEDYQSIFSSPKILHHPDRFRRYLSRNGVGADNGQDDGRGIVPITMEMDLTNVCSHRCPLCAGHRVANSSQEELFAVAGDGEEMPTEHAARHIRDMAEAGVRGLVFTGGGEPTVHSDLGQLVHSAASLGLDVGLITHGGLLHKHDVDALVGECTWIRVSVDASTPEEFRITHGRDTAEWERVWANLGRLAVAKRRRHGSRRATLGIGVLTGPQNAAGLPRLVERARDHGLDYVQVRPFHRYVDFDVTPHLKPLKEKFDSPDFTVVGSMHKYSLMAEGRIAPRDYSVCHFAQFSAVICANEKIYVCCHYRNCEDFCIGDLRKESFREVMDSRRRADVTARIAVDKCQILCRGDHVNRQVQSLLNGAAPSVDTNAAPPHVNFL